MLNIVYTVLTWGNNLGHARKGGVGGGGGGGRGCPANQ